MFMPQESRTARLTILIDPRKKAAFEALCAEVDLTPSQVVRKLIRDYIEYRTGKPWDAKEAATSKRDSGKKRRS
jgi:antitoxin component of RelBE/YafQ-DinJ toxin-antitoxin module